MRLHSLPGDRVTEWVTRSQPIAKQYRTAAQWPVDPIVDRGFTEYGRGIAFAANNLNYLLEYGRARRALWSKDGSTAVLQGALASHHGGAAFHVLVRAGGGAVGRPRGYPFVDFASDGESLLAVISRRIVDPNADETHQVLAKFDLKTNKVTWSSEPFTNWQGMVPYPAFDLKEFHGGQ